MARKRKSTRSKSAEQDSNAESLFEGESQAGADDVELSTVGGGESSNGNGHVSLHEAARTRYLNYAMSVITSRALPDVRDGLKPVQRRILYTMWQQNVTADAKHRKCAKIVGDVMGNLHPHGDSAIYEALVRMAQPFSLRVPLIDGSGNFGSLDGDPPAAMRYTECRLQRVADEMLLEIGQSTVDFRPNYDGTKSEPIVLPARIPNMLVNGATGIAVGMATNIPPHNLGEVCTALMRLLDNPELTSPQLCRWVKGPDFPTGGQVLNPRTDLTEIYKTGSGSLKIRGTWKSGVAARTTKTVIVDSIPYGVNKATLVEAIGQVVLSRKLPPLLNVRDVSTDDVRIELELKRDADEQMVMAYLFRHTPLQSNFPVNMTCLEPTENPEVGRPDRMDLREILWNFLLFRMQVVTRRLENELAQLQRRIHILEGFEKVFDALDEIIRIIRASDGKADAAEKIMKRFGLDAEQTDAILELKLYRLARLEILVIRKELEEKRARAAEVEALLASDADRWKLIRGELQEIHDKYGKPDKRRTIIETVEDEPEFSAEDFIVAEDNVVIISRDGWVKRQKEVKDLSTQRVREGDEILTAEAGSTRSTVVFMSNHGVAYSARIIDIPATTGYGEPIQKFFKLADGERIVNAFSLDERAIGEIEGEGDELPPVHGLAVTSDGNALRFGFEAFVEPSTRNGRKYARPAKGVEVVGVEAVTGEEIVIAATKDARALLCKAEEINFLAGAGKGVSLIKLNKGDRVLGFIASTGDRDLMRVETNRGAEQTISTAKYRTVSRGGKGVEIMKRGSLRRILPQEPGIPALLEE